MLAPCDYLSTFLKNGTVVALAIGIYAVAPQLAMPVTTHPRAEAQKSLTVAHARFISNVAGVQSGALLPANLNNRSPAQEFFATR